jgi:hypothetical protein
MLMVICTGPPGTLTAGEAAAGVVDLATLPASTATCAAAASGAQRMAARTKWRVPRAASVVFWFIFDLPREKRIWMR